MRVRIGSAEFWTIPSETTGRPAVIWLHGGPGLWDYLGPVASFIARTHASYRFDQRGCGRSSTDGPHTVAQNVADMDALRAYWNLERTIVAGHSWGASLALHYALAYPSRVDKLILISSHGLIDGAAKDYRRERSRRLGENGMQRRAALAARWEETGSIEDERAYCRENWAIDFVHSPRPEVLFADGLRVNRDVNRDLNADCDLITTSPAWRGRLRSLAIPTLVIHGAGDPRPAWAARDLAALLPRGELCLLEEAGHFPWLEKPAEFETVLKGFLGS